MTLHRLEGGTREPPFRSQLGVAALSGSGRDRECTSMS